jgi:hypothetical protein
MKPVDDWFVDGGWYQLPDGTLLRAVFVERDDVEVYWALKDVEGSTRFGFWDYGRVYAYVQVPKTYYFPGQERIVHYMSTELAGCDLTIDDLRPVTEETEEVVAQGCYTIQQ